MISVKFEVTQVFRDGKNPCVKAKILTQNVNLVKHPKYKTVSIYGNFPEMVEKNGVYIFTISDYPSDKGNYSLIYMGRLPHKETLNSLELLIYENPVKDIDEYKALRLKSKCLTSKDEAIILDYLKLRNKYQADDYARDVLKRNDEFLKTISKMYRKCEDIVEFRDELEKINIKDENVHLKIINNIKGDFKKAIESLKDNPYTLIDVADLELSIVDEIALSMGIEADDDNRIAAITEMNLRKLGSEGKTWVNKQCYLSEIHGLYSYDTPDYIFKRDFLEEKINSLGDRSGFYVNLDNDRIASNKYYLLEQVLYEIIKNLSTYSSTSIPKKNIDEAIKSFEKQNKITLLSEQYNAVYNSFKNDFSIIAGAAGTGKTTIAKVATNIYKNVIVTALSGKATLRISETTDISGDKSRTMHSFSNISEKFIDADLVIVDEASMIGLDIAIEFFKKIKPGTHVLLLGDHCQLTPIGAGNFFSDLIHSKNVNVSIIEEVHRQALDSNIIKFATNVRKQICNDNMLKNMILEDFEMYMLQDNREIADKAIEVFNRYVNMYRIEDIMLVSPQKNACYVLNNSIQSVLKREGLIYDELIEVSPQSDDDLKFTLHSGDRVINIENFHDCPSSNKDSKISVMNGSLGTVIGKTEYKNKKGKIYKTTYNIHFEGIGVGCYSKSDLEKRILLGYAITVHKSQGSQSKLLIYVHPERCYSKLNCSEMVYTAITRAKDKAVVISINNVLKKAVITKELNSKQTLLKEFLDTDCSDNVQEVLYIEEDKPLAETYDKSIIEVVAEECIIQSKKPFKKTLNIDSKTREKYDKNNAQKRAKRRNKNGLLPKEQSKLDKINLIKDLYSQGKSQKEIVEITGFAKGTVSKYLRL